METEAIKELNTTFNTQFEEYYTKFRAIFFDEAERIFSKYPALTAISWFQYTPFINESGDPSEFIADTNDFSIIYDKKNFIGSNDTKHDNKEQAIVGIDNTEIVSSAWNEIKSFLTEFNNEFYLNTFGNFRWVLLAKDGWYSDVYLPTLPKTVEVIDAELKAQKEKINGELTGEVAVEEPVAAAG